MLLNPTAPENAGAAESMAPSSAIADAKVRKAGQPEAPASGLSVDGGGLKKAAVDRQSTVGTDEGAAVEAGAGTWLNAITEDKEVELAREGGESAMTMTSSWSGPGEGRPLDGEELTGRSRRIFNERRPGGSGSGSVDESTDEGGTELPLDKLVALVEAAAAAGVRAALEQAAAAAAAAAAASEAAAIDAVTGGAGWNTVAASPSMMDKVILQPLPPPFAQMGSDMLLSSTGGSGKALDEGSQELAEAGAWQQKTAQWSRPASRIGTLAPAVKRAKAASDILVEGGRPSAAPDWVRQGLSLASMASSAGSGLVSDGSSYCEWVLFLSATAWILLSFYIRMCDRAQLTHSLT